MIAPEKTPEETMNPRTRDAGEQDWFRERSAMALRHCLQGWDWAFATSTRKLGNGTEIAMVGREGTVNGRFSAHYWECVCSGPILHRRHRLLLR